MPMNAQYRGPIELPGVIPVFPLPGALLLPRGQMPLNIFEPRYLAMIDDALRNGHRLIGMIQPGIARFRVEEELGVTTLYRQCRVSFEPYGDDFIARKGEEAVDRKALLHALT